MAIIIKRWTDGMTIYESQTATTVCEAVEEAAGAKADLRLADLRSVDLRSANLRSANLRSVDLRSANLRSANLSSANLILANLSSANLHSANLHSADLSSANLRSANLSSANLLMLGPIGSRAGTLYATWHKDDIHVRAGCFAGTLAEFAAAVEKTHGDNEHGRAYRAAIALIKARAGLEE